ncbi:hypothetical protein HU200_013990 [Digitaria exilis]|uniref:Enolase C-terminal domain-containing protein n=1 Tax=Digitaria exilis TaxID=1010633 RepID=A0A835FC60_9POAL|nr:hypothetical protein HU200_013990 [Digitaria exilis]
MPSVSVAESGICATSTWGRGSPHVGPLLLAGVAHTVSQPYEPRRHSAGLQPVASPCAVLASLRRFPANLAGRLPVSAFSTPQLLRHGPLHLLRRGPRLSGSPATSPVAQGGATNGSSRPRPRGARPPARFRRAPPRRLAVPDPPPPVESFGFGALKETFSVDVAAAEAPPARRALAAPFTIASSRLAPCPTSPSASSSAAAPSVGGGARPALHIEVLKAIRLVHPDCSFILDANEGYTADQAIELFIVSIFHLLPVVLLTYFVSVLLLVSEMGVTPVLLEQPVHRDDWEGLRDVSIAAMEKYKVAVAADESCRSLLDAQKIIDGNLAHVINIKLAKLGFLGALEIIDAARKANVALMIGGMVETRIAMGFAGHLAAGLGCFSFVDLDTPLLLSEDPVYGGYEGSLARCTELPISPQFLFYR